MTRPDIQTMSLYMGQEIQLCINIENNPVIEILTPEVLSDYALFKEDDLSEEKYKLLLRPVLDMQDSEAVDIAKIIYGQPDSVKWHTKRSKDMITVFRKHYSNEFTICLESGEIECYDEEDKDKYVSSIYLNQHFVTKYLLSKGFDLFNLIGNELALNKLTLKRYVL